MGRKLLIVARGGLSLCSHELILTRLSLSRSPKWANVLSSSSHQYLLSKVNNSVGQLNIQWRGWSYPAFVPSDGSNSQKGQRVSRDERRAMVESFVNKYRAANDGKFPTITDIRKQVGGGHYVVREIIQELKYKSKLNSSNSLDEKSVEKEQFKDSQLLTSEAVKVPSDNTETAKDRPIQDDFQLAVSDEIDAGHEHLEEKGGPHATSCEKSLSKEAGITFVPGSHFLAAESNQLQRDAEETSKSNHWTSVDVKIEEPGTHFSDSVARKSHLPIEDMEHLSAPFNKDSGTNHGNAESHESEFVNMEKFIEKAGYEGRVQGALKDLSEKHSQSSLQMPNDVETEKADSNYSDFVASETHLIKEEIQNVSDPFSKISGSNQSKDCDSAFADMENDMVMKKTSIEKAEYDRREHDMSDDLPSIDGPKHTMKQGRGTSETNGSKIDNSNREMSDAEVPKKTSLWGNLKSFADGIMSIWRKL